MPDGTERKLSKYSKLIYLPETSTLVKVFSRVVDDESFSGFLIILPSVGLPKDRKTSISSTVPKSNRTIKVFLNRFLFRFLAQRLRLIIYKIIALKLTHQRSAVNNYEQYLGLKRQTSPFYKAIKSRQLFLYRIIH